MHAEVIAIGDELTSGQRLDTNSQWLSQQLGDLGIRTLFHTTVADDLESNRRALREAASRVDIVVCTGGLGPTADDLTRQAIAESFDLPLELNDRSLAHIQHMFESRGREMPERNRVQAMFPRTSLPIPNPHGTAPGVDVTVATGEDHTCRLFSLPGVPAEMKEMWEETVRLELCGMLGHDAGVLRHFELKCFGTGESAMEAMLPDLIRRGREPTVGITVSQATITLRISGHGASDEAYRQMIQPTVDTIHQHLGSLVFGEGSDELHHVVGRMLGQRQQSLAVAEWGTGGLMGQWLSELPESDRVFRGGVILGDPRARGVLGMDASLDPQEYARACAEAVRAMTGADFGLAVGKFPDLEVDPMAKVFIGFSTSGEASVAGRRFGGHPEIRKPRSAKQALDLLRLHLLDSSQ